MPYICIHNFVLKCTGGSLLGEKCTEKLFSNRYNYWTMFYRHSLTCLLGTEGLLHLQFLKINIFVQFFLKAWSCKMASCKKRSHRWRCTQSSQTKITCVSLTFPSTKTGNIDNIHSFKVIITISHPSYHLVWWGYIYIQ